MFGIQIMEKQKRQSKKIKNLLYSILLVISTDNFLVYHPSLFCIHLVS